MKTGLRQRLQILGVASFLALSIPINSVWATANTADAIPKRIKAFLQLLDPQASFRNDGWVTFTNGKTFALLSPEEVTNVVALELTNPTAPQGALDADLIQLNDGHALLRVVPLADGRQTFALPPEGQVPLALKTALLPQQLSFPAGFLVPTAWKATTGNLLLPPSERDVTLVQGWPLAILESNQTQVTVWDTAIGGAKASLTLPCTVSQVLPAADTQRIFVACQNEPKLVTLSVADGSVLNTTALPAPAGTLVETEKQQTLWISYPNRAELSRLDSLTYAQKPAVALRYPIGAMVYSPLRNRLYGVSLNVPGVQSPLKSGTSSKKAAQPAAWSPSLQLVSTREGVLEKQIPAVADTHLLYIQDEKYLWMVSAAQKSMRQFDLRWQEYAPAIPITGSPQAVTSDSEWLYLLDNESKTLSRLSLDGSNTWGEPIALDETAKPLAISLDKANNLAFVLAQGLTGLQVVNLQRGEWVGTQNLNTMAAGQMAWVAPPMDSDAERVRIKFQDGRFQLENEPDRPAETLPNDLHGLQKNRSLWGQLFRPQAQP